MKASIRSVRIAPKKANLVAGLVRGRPVLEAIETLSRTNKKAARILEELLKSAVANAKTNDNQDPEALVVKALIVNKAQALHRGVPMARGRIRPMRKFLSHVSVSLGIDGIDEVSPKKADKDASQAAKKPVKSTQAKSETSKPAAAKKAAKGTTTSTSSSSRAKKPAAAKKSDS